MQEKILLVDDDVSILLLVSDVLEEKGLEVTAVRSGEEALRRVEEGRFDLILLDIMMKGLSGLEVCRQIRGRVDCPILFLSAKDSVKDIVKGLDLGADDYLTKPFAAEELLARIRALARRPVQWEQGGALKRWDLELDVKLCTLLGPGGSCSLSKRESRLLEIFLRNAGQTMTRELLLARVWGPDAPVEEGNLDNYIHFLRRRLSAVGSGARIVTVRGVGYRLEEGA